MNFKLDIQRSSQLLNSEYLFSNPFTVIHIFNRGIFYESITQKENSVKTRPLFIGDITTSYGPFNLAIDENTFVDLKNNCFIGQTIYLKDYLSNIQPDKSYSTKISFLALSDVSVLKNAQELLKDFLLLNEIQNGLGLNINLLSEHGINNIKPKDLTTPYYLENLLTFLIGRGSGLTPSGDDFIIGFLALIMTFDKDSDVNEKFDEKCNQNYKDNFKDQLLTSLNRITLNKTLTTKISHHFIECAINGHVDFFIISLLNAVYLNDLSQQKLLMKKISQYGHTSGIDLLTGIYFGMQVFRNTSIFGT